MIQVHTKYKNRERLYATRLSALDVLANLGAALRDNLHYMQLCPRLEAYDVTRDSTLPVIRIVADGPWLSDHDAVEILFFAGSEHCTLGELSDRFPPS